MEVKSSSTQSRLPLMGPAPVLIQARQTMVSSQRFGIEGDCIIHRVGHEGDPFPMWVEKIVELKQRLSIATGSARELGGVTIESEGICGGDSRVRGTRGVIGGEQEGGRRAGGEARA